MSQVPSNAVFTLRDLNRQPSKVLEAVRKFGSAEIRARSGEVFTISSKRDSGKGGSAKDFPDFQSRWKKLREVGLVPPSSAENGRIDRIIAGEE